MIGALAGDSDTIVCAFIKNIVLSKTLDHNGLLETDVGGKL